MIRFIRDGLLITIRLDEYGWDYAIEVRPDDGSPGSPSTWMGTGPREHWWPPYLHTSPLLSRGARLEQRGRFHRTIPFIGTISPPKAEQLEVITQRAIDRYQARLWDWRNKHDDEVVLKERLEAARP